MCYLKIMPTNLAIWILRITALAAIIALFAMNPSQFAILAVVGIVAWAIAEVTTTGVFGKR